MLYKDDFNITDPKLKDAEWAKRLIMFFTSSNTPLTYGKNYIELRRWQNSMYDMTEFKRPYKHLLHTSQGGTIESQAEAEKALQIDFSPLGLFELPKNIIAGEIDKERINIDADCFDPTIQADKEKEFDLLKNKKTNEKQINQLYKGIGIKNPNFKVGNQGEFNSNIDKFESLGLDSDNPEDVEFFASTFYRHNLETDTTQIINYLNDMNKLSEIQKLHINDILSLKCLGMRTYYNSSTGLPTTKYVYPENIFTVGGGTLNDKTDSAAIIERNVTTIGEFIAEIGEQNFTEKDYNDILTYATMGNTATPVLGTYKSGIDFTCNVNCPQGFCTWDQFFRFNISWGYIEWKTTDENEIGRYFQKTMKAYYLTGVGFPQKIFNFGYLNMQVRDGWESQFSRFSFSLYRVEGQSLLEICIPNFKQIVKCWLQFQYFLARAKPSGKAYDINSLRRVAKLIISEGGNKNDIIALMEMLAVIPDLIYSNGDEDSEVSIGGNGMPFAELKNGLDQSAKDFLSAIEWCKVQIMEQTGLNNARIAQSPSPEEAYKKTQLVTNQSENATYYINSSISNIYQGSGYRTFYIVQKTVKHSLFGIKQLKKIFGERIIATVKALDVPLEYMGITVRRFLRDREREEVRQITLNASMKGEIPEEIRLLINDIDDYKKAAVVLSYYRERFRKQQMAAIKQQQEAASALQAQGHKETMELETLKGKFHLDGKSIEQKTIIIGAQIANEGKMNQQNERLKAQPLTNQQRSDLKKSEDTHKTALSTTEKLVTENHAQEEK